MFGRVVAISRVSYCERLSHSPLRQNKLRRASGNLDSRVVSETRPPYCLRLAMPGLPDAANVPSCNGRVGNSVVAVAITKYLSRVSGVVGSSNRRNWTDATSGEKAGEPTSPANYEAVVCLPSAYRAPSLAVVLPLERGSGPIDGLLVTGSQHSLVFLLCPFPFLPTSTSIGECLL